MCLYSWPLNNVGVSGTELRAVKKSAYNSDYTKLTVVPQHLCQSGYQDAQQIPKSTSAQAPHVKWKRTMHRVGPHLHDSQLWVETVCSTFCFLLFISTTDRKFQFPPVDRWTCWCEIQGCKGWLYIYWKNPMYTWTSAVHRSIIQGWAVLFYPFAYIYMIYWWGSICSKYQM